MLLRLELFSLSSCPISCPVLAKFRSVNNAVLRFQWVQLHPINFVACFFCLLVGLPYQTNGDHCSLRCSKLSVEWGVGAEASEVMCGFATWEIFLTTTWNADFAISDVGRLWRSLDISSSFWPFYEAKSWPRRRIKAPTSHFLLTENRAWSYQVTESY